MTNQTASNRTSDQVLLFTNTVRHYAWLIILGTILFATVGTIFILLLPDHYKASTTILVDPHEIYPPDFRVEKLAGDVQLSRFRNTGLADSVLEVSEQEILAEERQAGADPIHDATQVRALFRRDLIHQATPVRALLQARSSYSCPPGNFAA